MRLETCPPAYPRDRYTRLASYVLIAFALYYLLAFLYVAYSRIRYPFELEWLEGSLVDQVVRVMSGKPIYVEPSFDQISYQYTPLYYYVSAWVSRATGVGFFPLRLVSLVSSLGCLGLIFQIAFRETGSSLAAWVGAGLFAATFRIGGAWFDIARVDMLSLFLALLGVSVFRYCPGVFWQVLAGVIFFLGFFAKQTAGFVVVPLGLWGALSRRGATRFAMPAAAAMLFAASTLYMNDRTQGWYWYYVFDLLAQHQIRRDAFLGFFVDDLLMRMFVPLVLIADLFARSHRERRTKDAWFFAALFGGCLFTSWAARMHFGGYDNTLIPVYCVVSLLAGIGLHERLLACAEAPPAAGSAPRRVLAPAVLAGLSLHCGLLLYDVDAQIPTPRDEQAGRRLLAVIASFEGDVYVPFHGYLQTLVGKPVHAQGMTVWDMFRGNDAVAQGRLQREINANIEQKKFAAIILDTAPPFYMSEIDTYYRPVAHLFAGDEFYPVTGMRTRPTYVLVPR